MRHFSLSEPCHVVFLVIVLAVAQPGSPVFAKGQSKGPSTSNPSNALWVTFDERLDKWRGEGVRIDHRIAESMETLEGSDDDIRKVEETYGDILALRRLGDMMTAFGEPAGVDFKIRGEAHYAVLVQIAQRIADNPAAKRDVQRRVQSLDKAIAAANKKIGKVGELAKKGNFVAACEDLYKLMDPLEQQGLWWNAVNGRRHPQMVPWDKNSYGWSGALVEQYRKEALQLTESAIKQQAVNYAGLLTAIGDAAQAIAASGQTSIANEQSIGGPQAFEYFGNAWIDFELRSWRARSLAHLRLNLRGPAPTDIEAAHDSFSQKIGPALAGLITADASRASAEEADRLYDEYLQKLPPVISRDTDLGLETLFAAALEKLAARSPELQADLQAYRACTSDLLRWRQRTSAAYVRAREKDFPPLKSLIKSSHGSGHTLFTASDKGGTLAKLYEPMADILNDAGAIFLNKSATVADLIGSQRRGWFSLTRLSDRGIGYVPVDPASTAAAREALAVELFAPGDAMAPTLEAQMALYTARQGDLVAAGGDILNLGIIGWVARYTTLPEDDRGLVRLGIFPPEPDRIRENDVIILYMIKPKWLSHRYLFVSLADAG